MPAIPRACRDGRRREHATDKPLPQQFALYIWALAHGDLGYSVSKQGPVSRSIAETLPRTLALTGLSLVLSLLLGVIIGTLQAARRDGWFDRLSSVFLLFFSSLPAFWGALMALLVFAQWWQLFPAGGMVEEAVHDYLAPWPAVFARLRDCWPRAA